MPDGVINDVGICVLKAFVPVHVLLDVNNALLFVSQYVLVTRSLVPDGVTVDVGSVVLNALVPVHVLFNGSKEVTDMLFICV